MAKLTVYMTCLLAHLRSFLSIQKSTFTCLDNLSGFSVVAPHYYAVGSSPNHVTYLLIRCGSILSSKGLGRAHLLSLLSISQYLSGWKVLRNFSSLEVPL